jgi:imidazolonepropionase-like amidohydrolase
MHDDQLTEFTLRREVQQPADILRSATLVAASLLKMEGQIGVIAPGAFADLLVVDGNPCANIALLAAPERHLKLVMNRGRIFKQHLDS